MFVIEAVEKITGILLKASWDLKKNLLGFAVEFSCCNIYLPQLEFFKEC